MVFGMLSYNDDKKTTFERKVTDAAKYYADKYGHPANRCHVHPTMLVQNIERVGDIAIVPNKSVMKNHFWLGTEK